VLLCHFGRSPCHFQSLLTLSFVSTDPDSPIIRRKPICGAGKWRGIQYIVFKKSIIPRPVIMIFSPNQYIVAAPTPQRPTKIEFIRINSISRPTHQPNHYRDPIIRRPTL
jgi:hypothetical protein